MECGYRVQQLLTIFHLQQSLIPNASVLLAAVAIKGSENLIFISAGLFFIVNDSFWPFSTIQVWLR
jgi:hypothetical protein